MMKKQGLLVAAIVLSATTFAQTTTPTATTRTPAEKAQMKDVRKDIKAYDNDKADAKIAAKKGDMVTAKADVAAAKTEKADIKADAATLKSEGVSHPVKTADKQVKVIDVKEAKIAATNLKDYKAAEKADVKAGNTTGATAEKADVKADRKELKKDIKEARRDGVKHIARKVK